MWLSVYVLFITYINIAASQQRPPPPPLPPGTCPVSCSCLNSSYVECTGDDVITELSFESMQLTQVPVFTGSYPRLRAIDLTDNEIETIPKGAFGTFQRAPDLREIVLKNNRITNIDNGAFNGSLIQIDLSTNQIEDFSLEPFITVEPTLESITVRDNRIDRFDPLPTSFRSNTFPFLTLDLSDNPIRCGHSSFLRLCNFEVFVESFDATRAQCGDGSGSLVDACRGGVVTTRVMRETTETEEEEDDDTPTRDTPPSSSTLELILGPALGVPLAFIVLTVVCLVSVLSWRSKKWDRKFQNVAEAQVEANIRLGRTLRMHDPKHSFDPRYTTAPFTVTSVGSTRDPLPHQSSLFPGSTTIFLPPVPAREDEEDDEVYSSIDNRPLPAVPPGRGAELDYEDAYILNVDSVPSRDVLPGIAIAKRRDEEAKRLSRNPSPAPIPSTGSDSETELSAPPTNHTLHTGGVSDTSPTTSQCNISVDECDTDQNKVSESTSPLESAQEQSSQDNNAVAAVNSDIYLSLVQ